MKTYRKHTKTYRKHMKIYRKPTKTYRKPMKTYRKPMKTYVLYHAYGTGPRARSIGMAQTPWPQTNWARPSL